jgi:hydroxyacylglutathione hydrolase
MPTLHRFMIHLKVFTCNAFAENTYLLWDDTRQGTIIDPGFYEKHEYELLREFISANKITLTQIVTTHCHVDHVLGAYTLTQTYRIPFLIPENEKQVLDTVKVYAPVYGFQFYNPAIPDGFLNTGTELKIGNEKASVLSVPGHSQGHLAFYFEKDKILIAGDVLFRESIGRTDLPGGNFETLINSIHTQLFSLPDEVTVYPGHGPETTIGHEKNYNPFCAIIQ